MKNITQALRLLKTKLDKPPLLVIDDTQLLFNARLPLDDIYNDIEHSFQWLLRLQRENILDVILCCSEKSVLGALKEFKHFPLTFTSVDAVDDSVIEKYLLGPVNQFINTTKIPLPPSRSGQKFTNDSARLFVETFDGNLIELEKYVSSGLSVYKYIEYRENVLLRKYKSRSSLVGIDLLELKGTEKTMFYVDGIFTRYYFGNDVEERSVKSPLHEQSKAEIMRDSC